MLSCLTCSCKSWVYDLIFNSSYQYGMIIVGCPWTLRSQSCSSGAPAPTRLLCCRDCGRGSILWSEVELQTMHFGFLGWLRSWDHWLKSSWHLKLSSCEQVLFFPCTYPCTVMWFKLVNILFPTVSGVKCPWWLPAWSSECLIFCCSLLSTWTVGIVYFFK